MKKTIFIITFAVIVSTFFACGQSNNNETSNSNTTTEKELFTASFTVNGACGMCKNRIEKAAISYKGVESAEWDKEKQMLKITYTKGIDTDEMQKIIAGVGHDTKKYKAKDGVYNSLPSCCKYR